MSTSLEAKLADLRRRLSELAPLAIAFSGGVDSTFLLRMAVDTLGRENVLAVTANSPLTAASELQRACDLATRFGAEHLVVPSTEFGNADLRANPPNRCYICKRIRFEQVKHLAAERGFAHLADGTNADDANDYRPGLKAAEELGVVSPLRDARLTKADVREASRLLDLPTADLPSFACLASRVPYGVPLTEEALRRIEQGEQVLADLGLRQYRLRDHGDVARLEVQPGDFGVLLAQRHHVLSALRQLGYRYVALDLAGYRTGSMNEGLL
ncbi:MAG: ATP-dependent sacrificial sulfur transferase LarE [Anaerolineae bacterium]